MELLVSVAAAILLALIGVIYQQLRERIKEHRDECDREIEELKQEVTRLRDWRHDEVAQFQTRHELDIAVLKAKAGL
jgi:gas vesicle protein